MKVLYVTNVLPYPPLDGGKIRRYQLAQALSREHEVAILSPAPDADALCEFRAVHPEVRAIDVPLEASGRRVRIPEAVRRCLAEESWDAVHVTELWQWPGSRTLESMPCVLDSDNVESELLRRLGSLPGSSSSELQAPVIRALEEQAYGRADRVLACSEHDASLIRAIVPSARLECLPNGVDLQSIPYSKPRPIRETPRIAFTGMLSYRPNVDAMRFFVTCVWPLVRAGFPAASFWIVGRYPAGEVLELARVPGVEVIPDVPDIRPYLAESDVMVVPLRAGSGTRLKILEAFAAGRPVVSTSIGCEGLDVQHGAHLRVADSPEEIAAEIEWVLSHTAEASAMTRCARVLVEHQYGWEPIGQRLLRIYAQLDLAIR